MLGHVDSAKSVHQVIQAASRNENEIKAVQSHKHNHICNCFALFIPTSEELKVNPSSLHLSICFEKCSLDCF